MYIKNGYVYSETVSIWKGDKLIGFTSADYHTSHRGMWHFFSDERVVFQCPADCGIKEVSSTPNDTAYQIKL